MKDVFDHMMLNRKNFFNGEDCDYNYNASPEIDEDGGHWPITINTIKPKVFCEKDIYRIKLLCGIINNWIEYKFMHYDCNGKKLDIMPAISNSISIISGSDKKIIRITSNFICDCLKIPASYKELVFIRDRFKNSGMTQKEIADSLGVKPYQVCKWFNHDISIPPQIRTALRKLIKEKT